MLKKSPQQLTPAALESALKQFVQAHEAAFDSWFQQAEARQRARLKTSNSDQHGSQQAKSGPQQHQ
jgi:hypothetical protein